ncbi:MULTISPECIES: T9SS type A sorting domain-containing protein [Flavobacterium]|uniref:T9SS type A sorting domain-containing protein n=1 Tax=Flavobacterium hankyongi TaxID=1176532 RepID=A0ABP8ZPC8_9FLAO|nr:T9SS type A sorting domain-containing protein [Flavobacterium sp. N1846]
MKRTLLIYIFLLTSSIFFAQCWQSVSAGVAHSVGIRAGGTLWTWGRNNFGQIGDGSAVANRTIPTQIGTASDWQLISCGGSHTLALKTNGTLWAWGLNSSGQLGNGNNTNSNVPVQVGTDTDWAIISAGDEFSLALKTNGTLWAWGRNDNSQLGDGSVVPKNSPIQIGNQTDWESISAGANHSLAIKTNGNLYGWGVNSLGQLGNGTTVNENTPVKIGNDTDWNKVAAGTIHSVAFKDDLTLWVWGGNNEGQLGIGTSGAGTNITSPFNIVSLNGCSVISKGSQNTIVKKSDGTVWNWGANLTGQLGNGTTSSSFTSSPIQLGSATDWQIISMRGTHVLALKNDGSLYAWGNNTYGQVGDGTSMNFKTSPTSTTCPTLSADEKMLSENISIYPNPSNGIINIKNKENITLDKVTIYDLYGKVVLENIGNISQINIETLSVGFYFIEFLVEGKQFQKKFIKN